MFLEYFKEVSFNLTMYASYVILFFCENLEASSSPSFLLLLNTILSVELHNLILTVLCFVLFCCYFLYFYFSTINQNYVLPK